MFGTAAVLGGGALVASLYYYVWGRSPTALPQFGVPLEVVPKAESGLPIVVDLVLRSIRQDCIEELGIFRQSGCRKAVRETREKFNLGGPVSLDGLDAHSRGDLLKLFLRDLPEPLFPFEAFDLCIDVEKRYREDQDLQSWISSTKNIIAQFPPSHRLLLQELCLFLKEVAQHADKNSMNTANLATCFGPNLLLSNKKADLQELLELAPLVAHFVQKCIDNVEQLFEETLGACGEKPQNEHQCEA